MSGIARMNRYAIALLAVTSCAGRTVATGDAGSPSDDGSVGSSDGSGGSSGSGGGSLPVTCTAQYGGSSSGEGPAADGGYCSNHDVVWMETCSDGRRYEADCYCLSCGNSSCCCGTSRPGCDGFSGEGGVPIPNSPCEALGSPEVAVTACGFPPLADP